MSNNSPDLHAIRRVFVDSLFGQFTYDLKQDVVSTPNSSRLLIIYGDNGSGKTTLLKLIFHMLTSEYGHGHKSFLARTQFKSLVVELENGASVIADRHNSNLTGSYNLFVKSASGSSVEVFFDVDEEKAIRLTPQNTEYPQYTAVMQSLSDLGISLYFLQDDRKVWSDSVREDQKEVIVYYDEPGGARPHRRRVTKPPPILDRAIDRFVLSVKDQALQASSVGDLNVSTIYNEIAKSIANSPVAPSEMHLESPVHALMKTLEEQSERSDAFAKFGLSSQLSIRELLVILQNARLETLPILSSVMTPYVNAIRARLDAVEATYSSVRSLVEGINGFFSNKEIEFDLENGLRIQTSRGERLDPSSLSSGEQQLLLLFCNALTAQHRPTLFIIDEPELSLNVKWQRQLVQALLRTTSGRPIQFVLLRNNLRVERDKLEAEGSGFGMQFCH